VRKLKGLLMSILFLVCTVTLGFNIQLAKSEPTTRVVPDDYEKIQWAVGNASDGDSVFVRAGTYYRP